MKDKNFSDDENKIIIYQTDDGKTQIDVHLLDESVWLTQEQMSQLFGKTKSTINEHIKNIFEEGELDEHLVVRKFGISEFSTKPTNFYSLDVIISVGYRVKSVQGTRFRIWATERLKEYIVKGFTMDDERLKQGGGKYWKELLERIRDIRSSEKMLYRQVLDLYAESIDYDPKSNESLIFFKIVQNKLHYGAHGHTAPEVIFQRVDSDKPFMGLTTFKGVLPTKAEAKTAKNYLEENEAKALRNLVSGYFDFAEMQAIKHKEMRMKDYVDLLYRILTANGDPILKGGGTISHEQAMDKVEIEFRKYQVKTITPVEQAYLDTISGAEKKITKRIQKGKKDE